MFLAAGNKIHLHSHHTDKLYKGSPKVVIIVQRHGEEDAQTRSCEEEASKESRGTDACIEELREYQKTGHGSLKGVMLERKIMNRKPYKPCIFGLSRCFHLSFLGGSERCTRVCVCASFRIIKDDRHATASYHSVLLGCVFK